MKRIYILLTLIIFFPITLVIASSGHAPPKNDPENQKHVIDTKKPSILKKGDSSEWRLWYIAKGTRSEGLHGALEKDGKWLYGKKNGEIVETELGNFVWHGNWDERKLLFNRKRYWKRRS